MAGRPARHPGGRRAGAVGSVGGRAFTQVIGEYYACENAGPNDSVTGKIGVPVYGYSGHSGAKMDEGRSLIEIGRSRKNDHDAAAGSVGAVAQTAEGVYGAGRGASGSV